MEAAEDDAGTGRRLRRVDGGVERRLGFFTTFAAALVTFFACPVARGGRLVRISVVEAAVSSVEMTRLWLSSPEWMAVTVLEFTVLDSES